LLEAYEDKERQLDMVKVATASHLINPSLDLPPHKAQETALRMLTSSIQGAIGKLSMSELSGNIVETLPCETDVIQFKVVSPRPDVFEA